MYSRVVGWSAKKGFVGEILDAVKTPQGSTRGRRFEACRESTTDTSRKTPPLTALGSPMRSKSVFVSHPSPLNPLPPCSAGTDGIGAGIGVRENWIGVLVGGNVAGSGSRGRGRARVAGRRRGRSSTAGGGHHDHANESGQRAMQSSHITLPTFHSITGSALATASARPTARRLFSDLERFVSSHGRSGASSGEGAEVVSEGDGDPFRPKPVSRFRPVRIEKQEVLQERD